jgi:hypothetical protein
MPCAVAGRRDTAVSQRYDSVRAERAVSGHAELNSQHTVESTTSACRLLATQSLCHQLQAAAAAAGLFVAVNPFIICLWRCPTGATMLHSPLWRMWHRSCWQHQKLKMTEQHGHRCDPLEGLLHCDAPVACQGMTRALQPNRDRCKVGCPAGIVNGRSLITACCGV